MTSHVTLKGQTRDPNGHNGKRKRLNLETVPKDHQWEMAYGLSNSHVTMTSRDPRRCCEAVRSAVLATAWLLVFFWLRVLDNTLKIESTLNSSIESYRMLTVCMSSVRLQ